MRKRAPLLAVIVLLPTAAAWSADPLVLQSDFGIRDAAVASMKGVAVSVSPDLDIYDLRTRSPRTIFGKLRCDLRRLPSTGPEGRYSSPSSILASGRSASPSF